MPPLRRSRPLLRAVLVLFAAAFTVAFAAAFAAVPAARAAEPPVGVAFDGTVTVAARSAGGELPAGAPLPGAAITLVAYLTDFDDPIQSLAGVADRTGAAVLDGVARPADGGPPVMLVLTAQLELPGPVDEPGCTTTLSYFGLVQDVASGEAVAVTIEAFPSSSTSCDAPFALGGVIRDERGGAVPARVSVSLEGLPDGPALGLPTFDAPQGAYDVVLPPEYLGQPARFTVSAVGLETSQVPFGDGCFRIVGQQGSTVAERAPGEARSIDPIDVVVHEVVLGEDCATQATPRPTLPPTDLAPPGAGPALPLLPSLCVLVGTLLIAVSLGAVGARAGGRPR